LIGERVENPDKSKLSKEPEFRVRVERTSHTIPLRGPARTAKAETRIVGLDGKDLSHEDIVKRLEKETPVLVAVDGRMVDAYYLQVARPETLVVVLGPWEGAPAIQLFPAPDGKLDKKSDSRPDKR